MKVIATKEAVNWFSNYHITEGNIYNFPNIIFDDGEFMSLSNHISAWEKEFTPIKESIYEIY